MTTDDQIARLAVAMVKLRQDMTDLAAIVQDLATGLFDIEDRLEVVEKPSDAP